LGCIVPDLGERFPSQPQHLCRQLALTERTKPPYGPGSQRSARPGAGRRGFGPSSLQAPRIHNLATPFLRARNPQISNRFPRCETPGRPARRPFAKTLERH
jgi:hypothetical protein